MAKLFQGISRPDIVELHYESAAVSPCGEEICSLPAASSMWDFRSTFGMSAVALNCETLFQRADGWVPVRAQDNRGSRPFEINTQAGEGFSWFDCTLQAGLDRSTWVQFSPRADVQCRYFEVNRSDVRYQNLMRNCEVRYQASTTTTTSQVWADHADPNFIPGSLSEHYCLAREYGGRIPSLVFAGDPVFTAWRTALQPRPYQVVFRTRLIPLTTALRNPTRRGFTGVGDAVFQSDLFSCQAVRASAEREDGSFPLMSSKCGKAYYSVPHLWKHTSLDDPSLEPWLDRLEKDTVFPVSDIYQVGTSSIQSARIFTIRVAGLEWEIEGRKKTAASCPVLLLEKDCQASC